MVGGYGCAAMIAIFLMMPFIGLFVPFDLVCYFIAWFLGLLTLIMGAGSLYAFDITDPEDWKMLFFSVLIPGAATALFILLGNLLGDMHLMELIQLIFDWFKSVF